MKKDDFLNREEDLEVLLIEDDDGDAELVEEMLSSSGDRGRLALTRARRLEEAFSALDVGPDVVVLDLMLPDSRGLETLRRVRERAPDTPVVVLSGLDDDTVGLDAVRNGAQDYVAKGPDGLRMLGRIVRYAVERNQFERQKKRLTSLETEVAERRQVEERLRLGEARLAEAQRIAHVGSREWEIPANRIVWSDETYRIFGRTARDFDGTYESLLRFLHPDDRDIFHRAVGAAYETHHPFNLSHRVVRPDGSVRHVQSRGETVTDDAGGVIRMVGTAQDVTDVTLAMAAARQQTAFISLLQKISAAANEAERIEEVLRPSLPEIRRMTGADAAVAIVFPDDGGDPVSDADAAEPLAAFAEAARAAELASPLAERLYASGKPEWTFDPAEMPLSAAARASGVVSAMGFPIVVGPTPVGLVQVFAAVPLDPSGTLIDVMGQIGLQIGRVVERRRAEERLRRASAGLETGRP